MQIAGKKIVIIGLSRSGEAAALLANRQKAIVYVSEIAKNKDLKDKAEQLRKKDIFVELGRHTTSFFEGAQLLITSPGVKNDALPIVWAKENHVEIISEIEFAGWFCPLPVIAITGTNGKTTVTTLIGEVLKNCGRKVIVCGNIGNPFSGEFPHFKDARVVVLEVSSFQLQYTRLFHPKISVLLNVTQNHFDHHSSFEEYFQAKARIFSNQDEADWTVLNFDDRRLRNLGKKIMSKVLFFARSKKDFLKYSRNFHGACWLEGENIVGEINGKHQIFLKKYQLKIKGMHNLENVMAVILAVAAQRVNKEKMINTLKRFPGVEHRCEFITTINDVNFINDSKSTTVDATVKALSMFADKSVILICGGRDKGSDFSLIKPLIKKKVCSLVLIGEAREKIKREAGNAAAIIEAGTFKEAVFAAFKNAKPKENVLLSPMCASFDMFKNYEHRGVVFKQIVREIEKKWICGRRVSN